MPMTVPPLAQTVIMCDCVHRDRESGKFNLLGAFNVLGFPSFPGKLSVMHVFLSLTEVNGTYDLRVRLIDVDQERAPIAQTRARLEGYFPLSVYEFVMSLPEVEFPSASEYLLQVFAGDEQLAERKLLVSRREIIKHG